MREYIYSQFYHLKRITINIFSCVCVCVCECESPILWGRGWGTYFFTKSSCKQILLSYSLILETYIQLLHKECHSFASLGICMHLLFHAECSSCQQKGFNFHTMNTAAVHSSSHSDKGGMQGQAGQKDSICSLNFAEQIEGKQTQGTQGSCFEKKKKRAQARTLIQ